MANFRCERLFVMLDEPVPGLNHLKAVDPVEFAWHHSDDHLFQITKLGTEAIVGGGYKSDMPGFGDVMMDEEIRAVLEYIKSTWPQNIQRRHDLLNGRKAP